MRLREHIEESAFEHASDGTYLQHVTLEVLLDIRDLLSREKPEGWTEGS